MGGGLLGTDSRAMVPSSGGRQPRFCLPSMHLQSGALENCQAGFRGRLHLGWALPLSRSGPSLLPNSAALYAAVTGICQRGVRVVPAWWASAVERENLQEIPVTVSGAVALSWWLNCHGDLLSWAGGPAEQPLCGLQPTEQRAFCRACRGSRCWPGAPAGSPQTATCWSRTGGLGVTPWAVGSSFSLKRAQTRGPKAGFVMVSLEQGLPSR